MTPIAVFIATTGGPVLIERITPEPAPQSMICLGRSSEVLPISATYDDFVRPGSGVIMREFGPYDEGAFRLDVSARVDMGQSWQLAVFLAHALLHNASYELSDLADAQIVLWLTGEVDYDLNVRSISHLPEKLLSSAAFFEQCRAEGKRLIAAAPTGNQGDTAPLQKSDLVALNFVDKIEDVFGLLSLKATDKKPASSNRKFTAYVGFVVIALFSLIWYARPELLQIDAIRQYMDRFIAPEQVSDPIAKQVTDTDFTLALTTDRGREPVYRFGEDLHLEFRLSKPAWLYCFYLQAQGNVVQIFPNPQISKAVHKDPFDPERTFILTGEKGLPFNIRFSPPQGREKLACYATTRDVGGDLPPALRGESLQPLADEYALTLNDVFAGLENTALATDTLEIVLNAK